MRTNVLVSYFCWYFSPKFQILVIVPQEVLASMRLVVLNVSVLQATTAPAVNNPSASGKILAFLEFAQVNPYASSQANSFTEIDGEYTCECLSGFAGVNCTEVDSFDGQNYFILGLVTFTFSVFLAVIVLTAFCLRQARGTVRTPLLRFLNFSAFTVKLSKNLIKD